MLWFQVILPSVDSEKQGACTSVVAWRIVIRRKPRGTRVSLGRRFSIVSYEKIILRDSQKNQKLRKSSSQRDQRVREKKNI